jgi:hypothetical protein
MPQNPEPGAPRQTLEHRGQGASQAYDERAFRYFLAIEQKRAERSGRIVLLLLVHLGNAAEAASIPPPMAVRLFDALRACVREIDFIGWYCTGSVVGAVLMQGSNIAPPPSVTQLGARVGAALRRRLPAAIAHRIQLRLVDVRCTNEY